MLAKIVQLAKRSRLAFGFLVAVLLVIVVGPIISSYGPTEIAGTPMSGAGWSHPLGTDTLGRDVLSRILHGGWLLFWMALSSTVATYLMAIPLGMLAAVRGGWLDEILMRGVDILIALPGMLVLLVILSATGSSIPALVLGSAVVRVPLVARVTRTATLEVFGSEFVEAAIVRGERTSSILSREVLPNIRAEVFSTVGLSFTAAVLIMSSLNFLGVGLQPPTADWGLMIAENRSIMGLNPYSVMVPTLLLALLTICITRVWDAYDTSPSAAPVKTSPSVAPVKRSVRTHDVEMEQEPGGEN